MSSAICFNLDQSKILSSGKGLSMNIYRREKLGIYLTILDNALSLDQEKKSKDRTTTQ